MSRFIYACFEVGGRSQSDSAPFSMGAALERSARHPSPLRSTINSLLRHGKREGMKSEASGDIDTILIKEDTPRGLGDGLRYPAHQP